MKDKVCVAWEVLNHGVTNSSYFQGCGTSHTEFDDVFTGIGDTPKEAMEDALEMGCHEWNLDIVVNDLSTEGSIYAEEEAKKDQEREAALEKWIEEQEEAGRVNIETATEVQLEDDETDTFDPDTFEWDGDNDDDNDCGESNYWFVSVRVREAKEDDDDEQLLADTLERRHELYYLITNTRARMNHRKGRRKKLIRHHLAKYMREDRRLADVQRELSDVLGLTVEEKHVEVQG